MARELVNGEYKTRIEHFALVTGILQPLITLPQIIQIHSSQSAKDVSLLTWLWYLALVIVFLIYGLGFNLRPVWIGQIIWVTMQAIIVTGILMYG